MPGVISIRFSKEERRQLREMWRSAGFPHLSAYVRTKLGFDPDGGIDPVGSYEDVDESSIIKMIIDARDAIDANTSVLRQIARAQGVRIENLDRPREYPKRDPGEGPIQPPDEKGWADVPNAEQEASPLMPAGFER